MINEQMIVALFLCLTQFSYMHSGMHCKNYLMNHDNHVSNIFYSII